MNKKVKEGKPIKIETPKWIAIWLPIGKGIYQEILQSKN